MKRLVIVQPTNIFASQPPSGAQITICSDFGKANDETIFVTSEEAPGLVLLLCETFNLDPAEVMTG